MEVDIRTLTFDTAGFPPHWECPALLNHDGCTSPVVYFRKPKHVTQEDFDRIIKAMRISMVVEDK